MKKIFNSEYVKEPLLSYDEYIILRNLNSKCEYIARDEDGDLCVYESKPTKDIDPEIWNTGYDYLIFPYVNLFKFITWENEEPYSIKKLIKDYEIKKEVKGNEKN